MSRCCGGTCGRGATCPDNVRTFFPFLMAGFAAACTYGAFRAKDIALFSETFPQVKYVSAGILVAASSYAYYKSFPDNKYTPLTKPGYGSLYEGKNIISKADSKNYIIADEKGSNIWSKGLSYIDLDDGVDNLYFSLCSTKIVDKQVTTIVNFDSSKDKISFFCTLKQVKPEEISIEHKAFESQDYTCIEVRDTAICLAGDIHLHVNELGFTNKAYVESVFNGE